MGEAYLDLLRVLFLPKKPCFVCVWLGWGDLLFLTFHPISLPKKGKQPEYLKLFNLWLHELAKLSLYSIRKVPRITEIFWNYPSLLAP